MQSFSMFHFLAEWVHVILVIIAVICVLIAIVRDHSGWVPNDDPVKWYARTTVLYYVIAIILIIMASCIKAGVI